MVTNDVGPEEVVSTCAPQVPGRLCSLNVIHQRFSMQFSLQFLDLVVTQAGHPEVLRDIILVIFDQMRLRQAGRRGSPTIFGFENASVGELELSLIRTVNELLVRWGRLQNQLGNTVVST